MKAKHAIPPGLKGWHKPSKEICIVVSPIIGALLP